jgi:WD40 repeat protein
VLAVATTDRTIRLVDPSSGTAWAHLPAVDAHSIRALCFSPDGARLAVVTNGTAVQVWDLRYLRRELAARQLDWEP